VSIKSWLGWTSLTWSDPGMTTYHVTNGIITVQHRLFSPRWSGTIGSSEEKSITLTVSPPTYPVTISIRYRGSIADRVDPTSGTTDQQGWWVYVQNVDFALSKPTVATLPADSITATLRGTVNPNTSTTTAWFEWGTSNTLASYSSTSSQSVGSGTSAVSVTANLTGLNPNTTYYYRVAAQNSTGTQRGAILSFLTLPEQPLLVSPSNGLANQSSSVGLGWSSNYGASSYRLQVALGSSFSPAILDTSGLSALTYQLSGLANNTTYFWRLSASNTTGSSAFSNSYSFSTVSTKSLASPGVAFPSNPTSSTDYRLVSFPGTSPLKVSDILQGTQGMDWRMFRDNGSSSNYFAELSSSSPLTTGEGYCLLRKGNFSFSSTSAMPQLLTDGTYPITVRASWNLIGNPFDVSVPWDLVKSRNPGSQSVLLWSYEGSNGLQQASVMEPYKGYYCNLNITTLKIPYPFPSMNVEPLPAPYVDWKIQLVLETDINKDIENFIGVAPSAKVELDELDQPKPPPLFDQGFISFSRPSWNSEWPSYNSDFRPRVAEGQVWEFEVTNPRKSLFRIRFIGIERVPSEFDIVLVNKLNGVQTSLREKNLYEYQSRGDKTPFALLVGRKAFIEQQVASLVPRDFGISQNYPNPFNPSTTISYQVPREAWVKVEVVSMLGQHASILADGLYAAGVYAVTWNSQEGKNNGLPSGVYFCRLIVDGKPMRTIKMLLVK
jgi:hypothetical protein